MAKFVVNTHGRLQEWIAHEKGYFEQEGLDYELTQHKLLTKSAPVSLAPGANAVPDNLHGAYQTYEQGREASISCACHWTVNMAASASHGRLWGEAYTVSPCGVFVPPDSAIRTPEDLADVEVHVGYQSGSHYTTIQALEAFMPAERIKLKFGGSPADRVDQMLNGLAPAATVFGMQYYILEQLGFRKLVDCTFMIAAMIPPGVDLADVKKYFNALRKAQADIDRMHQAYTHFYLNELPERHAKLVDVRRFGPGERIVFEPYSEEMYQSTKDWVEERHIFPPEKAADTDYARAVAFAAE
jgi:ABC-type nitrate/sulfonate/bicarbonate transport system substrate-binding protein